MVRVTQKQKALSWVVFNCSVPVNFFKWEALGSHFHTFNYFVMSCPILSSSSFLNSGNKFSLKTWLPIIHLTQRKNSSRITFQPTYANLLSSNVTHDEFTHRGRNSSQRPENFPFGFSVVHNTTLGKILEIQLTLITARRAKDCCRRPLLVAFKIPDIYFSPPVFFIQLTFHS